jgi:hypothetical protein
MRSARGSLFLTATVLAVALTGCSATVTGSPAPTGGASAATTGAPAGSPTITDPVAWTDKLCGSLLPTVKALASEPQIGQSDPASTVKGLSAYFGGAVSSLDESLSGIDAAGPSPIADTDPVVAKLKQTLRTLRSTFAEAKTAVDKVDPNNPADLATALPEALAPLANLGALGDPTAGLKTNPELKAAAAQAPNCQEINKLG